MIASAPEAQQRAYELNALQELAKNPEWLKLAAVIAVHHADHLAGATDRKLTAEQRATHLEAYHMAKELDGYLPSRIAALEKDLIDYRQKAGGGALEFEHQAEI